MFPEIGVTQSNNPIKSTLDQQIAERSRMKKNAEAEKSKDKEKITAQLQIQEQEGKQTLERKQQQQAMYRDFLLNQAKEKGEISKNYDKLDPEVVKMNKRDLEAYERNDPNYYAKLPGNNGISKLSF
jgi:hypothetical protein